MYVLQKRPIMPKLRLLTDFESLEAQLILGNVINEFKPTVSGSSMTIHVRFWLKKTYSKNTYLSRYNFILDINVSLAVNCFVRRLG